MCDWLEPQAVKINTELKKIGGLKVIDKASGQQAFIEKIDIFHSLLGEMKPGSVSRTTRGGHCFLTELRATSLSYDEIKSFGNGFFDMQIKPRRGLSASYKDQTYFPAGKSISDCTDMLIDAIQKNKLTECVFIDDRVISFEITNIYDQIFTVNIEGNLAKFHPTSPFASKKL